MSTIDQMLDRLFQQRTGQMQDKIRRQRAALRCLQDKRGVKVVDGERIIFEDREWMPAEEHEKLREMYENHMKAWRTYDIDNSTIHRMHKAFYESAERQLAGLPSLSYDNHYSLSYKLSVLVEEYRGMLAMGLREKLERELKIEAVRG